MPRPSLRLQQPHHWTSGQTTTASPAALRALGTTYALLSSTPPPPPPPLEPARSPTAAIRRLRRHPRRSLTRPPSAASSRSLCTHSAVLRRLPTMSLPRCTVPRRSRLPGLLRRSAAGRCPTGDVFVEYPPSRSTSSCQPVRLRSRTTRCLQTLISPAAARTIVLVALVLAELRARARAADPGLRSLLALPSPIALWAELSQHLRRPGRLVEVLELWLLLFAAGSCPAFACSAAGPASLPARARAARGLGFFPGAAPERDRRGSRAACWCSLPPSGLSPFAPTRRTASTKLSTRRSPPPRTACRTFDWPRYSAGLDLGSVGFSNAHVVETAGAPCANLTWLHADSVAALLLVHQSPRVATVWFLYRAPRRPARAHASRLPRTAAVAAPRVTKVFSRITRLACCRSRRRGRGAGRFRADCGRSRAGRVWFFHPAPLPLEWPVGLPVLRDPLDGPLYLVSGGRPRLRPRNIGSLRALIRAARRVPPHQESWTSSARARSGRHQPCALLCGRHHCASCIREAEILLRAGERVSRHRAVARA